MDIIKNIISRLEALEAKLDMLYAATNSNTIVAGKTATTAIQGVVDNENATCELSEDMDERITDIEIALCELSEQ